MKHLIKIISCVVVAAGVHSVCIGQTKPAEKKVKKEVLLVGTFHFNNPGADAVKMKSMDIFSAAVQKELEVITDRIKEYGPTKIFVEWDYQNQAGLDSLYALYLTGEYNTYVDRKYGTTKQADFYRKNELFQLAFKAGKKLGLKTIDAVDYSLDLPADSVFAEMAAAGQGALMQEIETQMGAIGQEYDRKMQTMSLSELILDMNTPIDRKRNNGFYIQYFNRAGRANHFAGALCVSEWYRRNLYMYSLIQKKTDDTDKKMMVLLGAGHTAVIKSFIDLEDQFRVVELKDILRNKK